MKARLNQILDDFRHFAQLHNYQDKPILTLYLDIDPTKEKNRKQNPAWKIELANELREVYDGIDPELLKRYHVQEQWKDFEEKIEMFLNQYVEGHSGRSVLILTDLDDISALDIQIPVETKAHFGMPRIEHLLYAMDKYKKYMVMILSEAEIRIVEVFLGRITNERLLETNQEVRNRFGRKASTLASDRRDLDTEERYAREIAGELNQYFMEDPDFERLILAGNQKIAHRVKNKLHPALRGVLVSIERMDIKSNEADVAAQVSDVANVFEEEHDLMVIEDLVALHNMKGSAVIELTDVKDVLAADRIKTLVVSYPVEVSEKYELICEASMKGVDINFVFGKSKERLDELGGIGAFLYYGNT